MGSIELPEFNEGALRISKRQERALARLKDSGVDEGQDLTSHDKGPRTSKSSSLSEEPNSRILRGYCGVKEFGHPGSFYTKPLPTPRKKKCLRTNEESSNCQASSLRKILSSANRDYRKEERHAIKGRLTEHPKEKDKYCGSAMRVWWRSNSRRNCHLCIKCSQLTFWPH